MVRKRTIKKIIVLTAWLLVIGGLGTLLVAANHKQRDHRCQEVRIGIQGSGEKFYIEKEDVMQLMMATANGPLIGRPVTTVDLARLEKGLETNPWIHKAELYIDNKDVMHVIISEREPIARIFTTAGTSFYMDSSGHHMPLLEKLSARVPVVTNYPDVRRMNAADSTLLQGVKNVAFYVYSHPFWNAQVGQIDITGDRRFELIPVVGDHIIRIGDGENVDGKLQRLYIFYQQVLSKVGFNKYAAVDVQFEGQVVAIKKGPASAVDSIQLQKNIEELMNRASMQQAADEEGLSDTAVFKRDSSALRPVTTTVVTHDSLQNTGTHRAAAAPNNPILSANRPQSTRAAAPANRLAVPAQRSTAPANRQTHPMKPVTRPAAPPKRNGPKPRAVMPRRM